MKNAFASHNHQNVVQRQYCLPFINFNTETRGDNNWQGRDSKMMAQKSSRLMTLLLWLWSIFNNIYHEREGKKITNTVKEKKEHLATVST